MTDMLATLHPAEKMTFDHGLLADLCDTLGNDAEAFIAAALTEVEALIALAATQQSQPRGLARTCLDMMRVADSIGMVTVSGAARAVIDCIDRDDPAATNACTARLLRLGHAQASSNWTVEPMTVA